MEEKYTLKKYNKLAYKKLNPSHRKQSEKINSKLLSKLQSSQKRQLKATKKFTIPLPLNNLNNMIFSPGKMKTVSLNFLAKAKTPSLYNNTVKNFGCYTPCNINKRENKLIHEKINTNSQRKTCSYISEYNNNTEYINFI